MFSLALNSMFSLNVSRQSDAVQESMKKLSSGQRINSAADDAAGISIAEGLRSVVMGSQQAQANIQDAINLVKVGEDGVMGMMPALQRIRELVLQAGNGTYTDEQRQAMQNEIDQVKQELPQAFYVAHQARVNLDGKDNSDRILNFQVGPNSGEIVSVDYNPLRDVMYNMVVDSFGYEDLYNSPFQEMLVAKFGSPAPKPTDPVPPPPIFPQAFPPGTTFAEAFPSKLKVVPGTDANITTALGVVDTSISGLVDQSAYLGAIQNRLESTLTSVMNVQEDVAGSESQIRDTDMAAEVTNLTKNQVISQSAMAMLSQSNQRPFQILDLLKNGR